MYRKLEIHQLDDFFLPLSNREERGIYFYRIGGYNDKIAAFIRQYLIEAKRHGVVLQGKIPNPDEKQLAFYQEIMGRNFEDNSVFVNQSLQKWLPRLNETQRMNVTASIVNALEKMKQMGKSLDMQKNAYIKFMCWLYYKFERVLIQLGQEQLPKILYEGTITKYELDILSILAGAGCDILLLEQEGDEGYQKIDPNSEYSKYYKSSCEQAFPEDFTVAVLEKEERRRNRLSVLYQENDTKIMSTNTWITGNLLEDSLKKPEERGKELKFAYNLFVRINGVEDKLQYPKELFEWKKALEEQGRNVFAFSSLTPPENEEIRQVNPKNYKDTDSMILDLINKIKITGNHTFDQQIRKAFITIVLEEEKRLPNQLNKLKNEMVVLICWLNRYYAGLVKGTGTSIGTFVYFNVCENWTEVLFLKLLSWSLVDVFVINPDLKRKCMLTDSRLFERNYEQSLELKKFPESIQEISAGTVAYHAEQELNGLLYGESGLYRDQQYQKAETLLLHTMCEEVYLLWEQELKYRPNFEVIQDKVILPVIGAKICGVKNQDVDSYWREIQKLYQDDTILFLPKKERKYDLSIRSYAPQFLKNGRLERKKIKEHRAYGYGIYREEVQEYVLDKIQELIDSQLIKGTFVNGMEYTILAIGLGLATEWMREIQKFDFTKRNPKLLLIALNEEDYSLEDSILIALLSRVGFDIALFVPTGLQILERYYTKPLLVEHQAGNFMFDLKMPPMRQSKEMSSKGNGLLQKIFKRG